MSHGHASTVGEFVQTSVDALIGSLVKGVSDTGISSHTTDQIEAWMLEIQILQNQLSDPLFQKWFIAMEYEIPRRSHRPDVVLLSQAAIYVIEFKVGARSFDAGSIWQVNDYARDLRDFHAESQGRPIIPVLCATEAEEGIGELLYKDDRLCLRGVGKLAKATGRNLGEVLSSIATSCPNAAGRPLDFQQWLNSEYRPTPTIIEAATKLYEANDVQELAHHHAADLNKTTDMIIRELEETRKSNGRTVIFVTGVPGAGKTLTGLNVVHNRQLQTADSPPGIFLSGNGPLVKVVQEALVRSRVSNGSNRRDSRHEVTAFIQNVHVFLREYLSSDKKTPPENLVVFDEAQRAWDASQMDRKRGIADSEPTLLLEVMERLPNWSVVVALVGGGQEIYIGEAGLEEWGRALSNRPVAWRVVASPEVLGGGNSVAGHQLFEGKVPENVEFKETNLAHLEVTVRSHRAQRWAEWVNEFLSLRFDTAEKVFPNASEFPCFVTRSLDSARRWLRELHSLKREARIGLVATSEDQRLRSYGLERTTAFRSNYPFDRWFLDDATDIRSSVSLEVAASEFECQGLELDYVGLCWGGDLSFDGTHKSWNCRRFRGAGWQNVGQKTARDYVINRYRVLLTRARKGLVIWVPKGDPSDPTRNPARLDLVFQALCASGVHELEVADWA